MSPFSLEAKILTLIKIKRLNTKYTNFVCSNEIELKHIYFKTSYICFPELFIHKIARGGGKPNIELFSLYEKL